MFHNLSKQFVNVIALPKKMGGIILSNNIFHVHNSPPQGGRGGTILKVVLYKKRKFLTFLQIGNLCASSEREGWPDQKYTIHSKVVVMVTKLRYPPWLKIRLNFKHDN